MSRSVRRTENTITIHADPQRVFQLAADIERWPEILPHYRWVRWGDGCVEMAARRGWLPVKWTSSQVVSEDDLRITYNHIGGLTRGMYVEWILEPLQGGVRVTILHDLLLDVPIVSSKLGKWVVAECFVKHIADRTLQHIKQVAEEQSDVL